MTILAITTMRNEGPFVLEWLAHHRAIGVGAVLVFSNDCDDGTDALLDALAEGGAVTHVRHAPRGGSVQWQALKAAKAHPLHAEADWAMCIDCDEFVVPMRHDDLPALLAALETDALLLPWRLFGSSGHLDFSEDPVTERFTRAAPPDMAFPATGRFFKTLYRVAAFQKPGIHRPKPRPNRPARWADGSGRPLPPEFAAAEDRILAPMPVRRSAVQLNHYSLRSAADFLVKRRRGLPNRASKPLDATYWAERNFNAAEDRSVLRHKPARDAEMARLLALPGVAEAREAAIAAHRARIAACLADPDEARLFTRLALLPGSVPPPPDIAARLFEILRAAGT